jgi:hypothetical protein
VPAPPAPPAPPSAPSPPDAPSCPLPAAGDLWRASDGRVFAYLDRTFHWVPTLEAFEAWEFSWGNVRDVPDPCLVGAALGQPFEPSSPLPPGDDEMVEAPAPDEAEEMDDEVTLEAPAEESVEP